MLFGLNKILEEKISNANLRAFCIGYDLGVCRIEPFAEILLDGLVDFAFGYHTGILKKYDRRLLIEAAKSIYKINNYEKAKKIYLDDNNVISSDEEGKTEEEIKYEKEILRKGEFGELLLHIILHDYYQTVPLISKIFFKDSDGFAVHGFDSIHIGKDPEDPQKDSLFLGESKIYYRSDGKSGEHGVKDLATDIQEHFNADFLRREFALVSKKRDSFKSIEDYDDENTKKEYEEFLIKKNSWIDELHQISERKQKLQDILGSVTIPVICTYQSKIFEKHRDDSSPDFANDFNSEINALEQKFREEIKNIAAAPGQPVRTDLNIVLIMLPIPSKKELVLMLHQKTWRQSNA